MSLLQLDIRALGGNKPNFARLLIYGLLWLTLTCLRLSGASFVSQRLAVPFARRMIRRQNTAQAVFAAS